MQITLVVPDFLRGRSFLQPPLGILYTAAMLEEHGHNVAVIDNRVKSVPADVLCNKVKGQNPDVIGITTSPYDQVQTYCVDSRIYQIYNVINEMKNKIPGVPMFVCGAHGTVRPDILLRDTLADTIVRGEPEATVVNLVEAIGKEKPLTEVENIAFREDSRFVYTKMNPTLSHPILDDDLMPSYEKVDMSSYFGEYAENNAPRKRGNWSCVIASRGCPFNCVFCYHYFGKKMRYRDPLHVVEEIRRLRDDFNIKNIFFMDFVFTLKRKWTTKICEGLIRERIDVSWGCETRCDLVDLSILKQMKKANCNAIWLGIETFSPQILSRLNKDYSIDIVHSAIRTIKKSGIKPFAFIMVGCPSETVGTLDTTFAWINKYNLNYTKSVIICNPRFETDLYRLAKRQYPFLGETWSSFYEVAGLVDNEITPSILRQAMEIMMKRDVLYEEEPLKLKIRTESL